MLNASPQAPHGGGESDGSAPCCGMSGCPAERLHHSAQRPEMARAGVWGHELNYTATIRNPPTPQPELFSLYDEEPGGSRPDRMPTLSGPQERDLRQIVDVPLVPLLDDPVPQMVEQLPDVLRFFDLLLPVPEQDIEVPKILLDDVPVRAVLRDPQLVEQLVEVPTTVSYSSLQRTVEQNVDIPAPGRGGRISGLQGFLPEQSSTAWLAAQERSSERVVEQIVDSRAVGGGLQEFRPGQGSSASSSVSPGHAGEGVFRTFPQKQKSAKWTPHSGSELSADFTSSTPAAQLASNSWYDVELDQTWLRFVDNSGRSYWCLLRTGHSQWEPPWERRP